MTLHIEQRLVQRIDNHPNKDFENGLAAYISIHETANPNAGSSAHAAYLFREGGAPYSWHVTVDDSTTSEGDPMVYQSFPWSSQCWHAGDGANGPGNTSSIGIELCVNNDMDIFTDRVMDTGAQLVAHLRSLGHGKLGIVPHQNWSGKNCPTRILENNLWDGFLKRVARYEKLNTLSSIDTEKLAIETSEPDGMMYVPQPMNLSPIQVPPQQVTPQQVTPKQMPTAFQQLPTTPAFIKPNRTLKKAGPEIAATGSTGGILALLNSVGIDVEMEVVIAVMIAIPPLLFAARRLIRDALRTIKELRDSV